jgi:hypothetical protein
MVMGLINANPVIHEKKERRVRQAPETTDENAVEPIDQLEIFYILLYTFSNMNVVKLIFLLCHVSKVLYPTCFVVVLNVLTSH